MRNELEDLPVIRPLVPWESIKWKGKYIDNEMLSNYFRMDEPMVYRDNPFFTTEAMYQAMKNPDYVGEFNGMQQTVVDYLGTIPTYMTKKVMGRKGGIPLRKGWRNMEVAAMASCIRRKYPHRSKQAEWLMEIPDDELVEWSNWGDHRWGVAVTPGKPRGVGRNALGLLHIRRKRILRSLPSRAKLRKREEMEMTAWVELNWTTQQKNILSELIKISKEVFGQY